MDCRMPNHVLSRPVPDPVCHTYSGVSSLFYLFAPMVLLKRHGCVTLGVVVHTALFLGTASLHWFCHSNGALMDLVGMYTLCAWLLGQALSTITRNRMLVISVPYLVFLLSVLASLTLHVPGWAVYVVVLPPTFFLDRRGLSGCRKDALLFMLMALVCWYLGERRPCWRYGHAAWHALSGIALCLL